MTEQNTALRPAARVQNLTKTYGSGQAQVVALDDVTLDLYAGEFTAVMGPSGSGKSTLMHCCAALDTATSEEIMAIFQQMNDEKGITVILVTHEADIGQHAQRIIRMRDGVVQSDAPVENRTVLGKKPATEVLR